MRVALDTETGGLDPVKNPLLSLAIWSPELEEHEAGPFKIGIRNDGKICEQKALEVNGLDPKAGVLPIVAAMQLESWWKRLGSPRFELIGHNVGAFDVPFVKQLTKVGIDLPWPMMFNYHYRDSAVLALTCSDLGLLTPKVSLTSVCKQLNINYAAHDALQDAKAAWHAWERMMVLLRDNKAQFTLLDLA